MSLSRLKGSIDRSWELHPQDWNWPIYHGHQNHPEEGRGNEAADSRPQPRNVGLAALQWPEQSCSRQCQEALGFHPSLVSNDQFGEILVAP